MCSPGVNGGRPEARRSMPERLKPDESWVEDRTVADLQIARMIGYRGESPIEMGNSRFRVKLLVGRRLWRLITL